MRFTVSSDKVAAGGQGGALPPGPEDVVGKGALGRRPIRWGRAAALRLYRIFCIAFSLAYCGVGSGWVVGYRLCQSFEVGCQPPRPGGFTQEFSPVWLAAVLKPTPRVVASPVAWPTAP